MKQFELEITSLDATIFHNKCDSLRIPTADGYYGIQADFNPSIISMVKGKVYITSGKDKTELVLNEGIVITGNNKATILID